MIQSPNAGVEINQELLEGGNEALDEKSTLIEEFGIDTATLDFNIEDFTVEELREKFQTMKAEQTFALAQQFLQELSSALRMERIDTDFGDVARYWYIDHDTELCEVYFEDITDWNIYGASYSMDGDNVVIDFESKKRKKYAIVDFDEGEQGSMKALFELASQKLTESNASLEELNQKFSSASADLDAARSELIDLREFKTNTEKANLDAKRNEVFAMFSDLAEVDAFKELQANCDGLSVEDLEEKCYSLRGRYGTPANFSAKPADSAPKLPAGGIYNVEDQDEPYGGVFLRFGYKAE